MTTRHYYFFDSHGGMHATCDAADPGAAAFGPEGASRPASPGEVERLLNPAPMSTAYAAARDAGRVFQADADAFAVLDGEMEECCNGCAEVDAILPGHFLCTGRGLRPVPELRQ